MKKIISASVLTIILSSCGQQENPNPLTILPTDTVQISTVSRLVDSVSVQHVFLVNSPFSDVSEMDYFNKLMSKSTKTSVKKEKSIHDNTLTNTIKTIEFGKSVIETLTTNDGRVFLNYASINDKSFELKNKIKIGFTVDKVFSEFNVNYDKSKIYKFLEISTPDTLGGTSTLTFNFKQDTLSNIFYWPYSD